MFIFINNLQVIGDNFMNENKKMLILMLREEENKLHYLELIRQQRHLTKFTSDYYKKEIKISKKKITALSSVL